MGKRQNVLLAVVIQHRERQLVIMVNAFSRRRPEVIQRVVHPAHIPLVVEAESALVHSLRHHGIIGGVLRAEYCGRVDPFQPAIQGFQKTYTAHVLSSRRIAHVIDNAADGVHAQSIKVVFRKPVISRGFHEAAHRTLGEVKIAAAPLAVCDVPELRLIGRSSVKLRQRVSVHRKMHRNEIHQYGDAVLVADAYQLLQSVRRAISGGRREKSRRLVSPAFVAGIFVQRHKLNAVVAVLLAVLHQPRRDLLILEPPILIIRIRAPAAKMYFINIQRVPMPGMTVLHPF